MSTSPFMDDYSSEDYSDHDDDYYFVPTATKRATKPLQVRARVEIQTQSNELQNLIIDQQKDVSESVYFDILPELEAETAEVGGEMEQSIYLAVESYFDLEAQAEIGVAAALEAETTVEELAVGSYFDLEAQAEIGVAAALEAQTVVEELTVESYAYFDLEAQVETSLPAALDTETVLEEGDVIESESLEIVEADTVVETVESMIEEFIYEAVESESDLEAEDAIEEPNSDVEHEADTVAPEAETAVGEEDVIEELPETVVADAALNLDTAVEEGDVIGESIYEAVESDYDLEAETEAEDMVEEEGDVVEEEEDMVEEDMVEEVDDVVEEEEEDMVKEEGDVVEEEEDMVEEVDDVIEEEDDVIEEEDDVVEEEHDVIDVPLESDNNLQAKAEAEALVEGAAMEESIYGSLESKSDFQGEEPEALAEPAVSIEMTTFKAQEPDSDLEPVEPEDQFDEQSDSSEEGWDSDVEESDLNEKEWDSDAKEIDMDPEDSDMNSSDSDLTEEEEDDVVVSYLKSSTTIRNKAWKGLVPALAWAKLPVTDTTTLQDSSLLESFLGCGPMLILQECGNALMNVIETLLCELLHIRNGLRRVLGALFRKRETTKHT